MNLVERQKFNQRVAMSFDDKLTLTIRRIKDWYDHWDGDVYVAFSGGKDSTVLLHIVRSIYPDVVAVFSNTGLEVPEIVKFARSTTNVIGIVPKKPFNKVIEEDGFALVSKQTAKMIRVLKEGNTGRNSNMFNLYNTGFNREGQFGQRWKLPNKWRHLVDSDIKVSEACCDHLKKEPLDTYASNNNQKPFTAMMASEGGARARLTQCNAFDGAHPKSSPMLFWTDDDVWEYIKRNNITICEVYYERIVDVDGNTLAINDLTNKKQRNKFKLIKSWSKTISEYHGIVTLINVDGEIVRIIPAEKRTGCMFCMFGVHMEKGANRFQKMYYTHPRHWDKCINKLGLKEPLELINVKYIPEDDS